jgi:hypothetical protein
VNATEFCYWLQGYIEVTKAGQPPGNSPLMWTLNQGQLDVIDRHLALVFRSDIDPKQGPPAVQQQLQTIHDGLPSGVSIQPAPYSVAPPGTVVRC